MEFQYLADNQLEYPQGSAVKAVRDGVARLWTVGDVGVARVAESGIPFLNPILYWRNAGTAIRRLVRGT